jgi:hypothetical protein
VRVSPIRPRLVDNPLIDFPLKGWRRTLRHGACVLRAEVRDPVRDALWGVALPCWGERGDPERTSLLPRRGCSSAWR